MYITCNGCMSLASIVESGIDCYQNPYTIYRLNGGSGYVLEWVDPFDDVTVWKDFFKTFERAKEFKAKHI